MKKIQKVIEDCHECEFCEKFETKKDNYTHVFVCALKSEEAYPKASPFLLDYSIARAMSSLPIPENCPLEDYTGTQLDN